MVATTGTAAATDVVRAWVRSVMAAEAATAAAAPVPVVDVPATDLVAAVRRHRVEALLLAAPSVDLPDEVTAALLADRDRYTRRALLRARELVRLVGLLEERGVRTLAFKGVALAVTTAGDLAARGDGDIDLLVSPVDLPEALAALWASGYVPSDGFPREPGSWGWRWLTATSNELSLSSPHASVDLHWHLTPTRAGTPDFETLWASRVQVRLGGRSISTLSPGDALWHSCSHAAKDDWRWLRSLVDVHRLARSPEAWGGLCSAGRQVRRTLAVVDAQLGLPATVPDAVRVSNRAAVWTARRSQRRPARRTAAVPGLDTVAALGKMLRSGSGFTDAGRALGSLLLPSNQLADGDGDVRTARGAVRLRGRHVVTRMRSRAQEPDG